MKKIFVTVGAVSVLGFSLLTSEPLVSIDSGKIMQESKEGKEIALKLQKEAERIGSQLKAAQDELIKMQDDLNKKSKILSPEALQEKAELIAKKKKDAERDLADKDDAFKNLIGKHQMMLGQKQAQVIKEVSEKEKWGMVIDSNPRVTPGVVYVASAIDKTDVVLKAVDEKYLANSGKAKVAAAVKTAKNDVAQEPKKEVKVA